MKTPKVMFILFIGITMLVTQVGSVFAAPALQGDPIAGEVTALECGTDGTTVIVTYFDENLVSQEVEVSLETAVALGLIAENTECSDAALADGIGDIIDPALVTPVEEAGHPVGTALAKFFEEITDYDTIMKLHDGEMVFNETELGPTGFGVIAQVLWLTLINEEDTAYFLEIIKAKESGDFDYFANEDEAPQNWGQLKKALLNGEKKANLGAVMSDKNKDEAEAKMNNGKGQGKDKSNNGKGKGNNE